MKQKLEYYVGLRVNKDLDREIMAIVERNDLTKTQWLKALIINELNRLKG